MTKSRVAGARALKTHLGAYLRKVRNGATIVVTDRGEPIAELRPLDQARQGIHPGLARLLASGAVTRETTAPLRTFRALRGRGAPLSAAVSQDREDRF
jgi:prevent-host-death family protein